MADLIHDSAEAVLHQARWNNERTLAKVRAVLWLGLSVGTTLAFGAHPGVWAPPLICSLASAAALVWMRSRFHKAVPLVLLTLDIVGWSLAVSRGVDSLVHGSQMQQHVLYGGMLTCGFTMIGLNVLRSSISSTVWSVICACMAYTVVIGSRGALDPSSIFDYFLFVVLGVLICVQARATNRILGKVRQRDAFARFLPAPLVELLSDDPSKLNLGGDEHVATVLFSDVRNFTAMSNGVAPTKTVTMLNEYLTSMVDEIFKWDGILDKFIGDGICAVFGPPLSAENQARQAMRCALGMLARLEQLNHTRAERGEPPLAIGIGVHTGPLIAGNIGSPRRLEYTHIGDTVNTASRIEGLTKEARAPFLVSEAAYRHAGGDAVVSGRAVEPLRVKGKPEPLLVYAVTGLELTNPGRIRK